MSLRTPALVAVGALAAAMTLAASADAATQHHTTTSRDHHPSFVRIQTRSLRPATSVALFGAPEGNFQAARNPNGNRPHKTAFFGLFRDDAVATAIDPVGGDDALLCGNDGDVIPVHALRTKPRLQRVRIDGRPYAGEGGPNFGFFCDGVSIHGSFALATGDSQGLLQLAQTGGQWKVDRRVHSPGTNQAGRPHRRGWIDFQDSTTTSTTFNNVAIAPRHLANGKYLAVALDRSDGALVVVEGVGTARPQVVGALQDDTLFNDDVSRGNGGIAFLPHSANRAVILTAPASPSSPCASRRRPG